MVIRLVSGWRGGFLYLSVWLCPPGPDLAALHPDWGSGRGIWDRRRRGGTVSSQRLLQSLQEGAEAEGREARQLQVGLRRESALEGPVAQDPPHHHHPAFSACRPLVSPLSAVLSSEPISVCLSLLLVSLPVSVFIAVSRSLPFVSTCADLCLSLRLLWLGAQ